MRRLVKTGMASTLHRTGVDRVIGTVRGVRQRPVVFAYHRVVEDARDPSAIPPMLVTRATFERHLDWIGRRFRVVSLDELGSRLEPGEGFGTPVAAVAFDDGYRDVYEQALPVLKRKGIPSAVFVVTDWIGSQEPLTHDRLYLLLSRAWPAARDMIARLDVLRPETRKERMPGDPFGLLRLLLTTLSQAEIARVIAGLEEETTIDDGVLEGIRPMSWDMVAEMRRAGITVGSHTRSHAVLTREPRSRVLQEAAGSRRTLEERLGARIDHFAYPDGAFNTEVVEAVAEAGYRFAYTTCHHRARGRPALTIPRRVLWEGSCLDAAGRFSAAVMSCVSNGVFDFAASCRRAHGASLTAARPSEHDARN